MRVGLIDLGTNSVRLYVFEQNVEGTFQEIFKKKIMVQLGVGLFTTGDFTPEAEQRTIEAFRELRAELDHREVSRIEAVATCAMREALSGERLQEEILQDSGIAVRIISGEEEAQLIAAGILEALGPFSRKTLFIDIGGGSTELTYVEKSTLLHSISTPLGAVRCQELILQKIPSSREHEEQLRTHIRKELATSVLQEERSGTQCMYGSSGSVRAILRMIHQKGKPQKCTAEELTDFARSLRGLKMEELLTYPELEAKRATILFSAAIILDEIAQELGIQEIHAIPLGLKDGLLAKL